MEDNNELSMEQFLINAEFSPQRGYSYGELIKYLLHFQAYYRDVYVKKDAFEQELYFKNKTFSLLEDRILQLENIIKDKDNTIKDKDKQNEFLISKINRNLTVWERISGKVKIKY